MYLFNLKKELQAYLSDILVSDEIKSETSFRIPNPSDCLAIVLPNTFVAPLCWNLWAAKWTRSYDNLYDKKNLAVSQSLTE